MTISVLTATLGRRPAMLLEAVESVRAQTFGDWEHLIIDDGSFSVGPIDGTSVVAIEHRGLGPARNAGLDLAGGEAVALLDDDDLWHPEHLATVWNAMQETGADVIYADCDEIGRRDGYETVVLDFDPELLDQHNFICVPATLIRTEALRAVGGFVDGPLEDWETWKRLSRNGARFKHVPGVTVTYRFHTDNLTYGGADPERTRAAKELQAAAERGDISWAEYEQASAEVWG